MLKNKKVLSIAIILLIISMGLNFPFPHRNPFGETAASVLGIPIRSVYGFHYVGITSLLFLIVGVYLLAKSFEKYHGRIALLGLIIFISLPFILANSFQKTFATGIYALSHESESSHCNFEMIDTKTLYGECELALTNYSKDDVVFTIEFDDPYELESGSRMILLMNNDAPYEVMMKGKRNRNIEIETYIDVSKMENYIESGSAEGVAITIRSGKKSRHL